MTQREAKTIILIMLAATMLEAFIIGRVERARAEAAELCDKAMTEYKAMSDSHEAQRQVTDETISELRAAVLRAEAKRYIAEDRLLQWKQNRDSK